MSVPHVPAGRRRLRLCRRQCSVWVQVSCPIGDADTLTVPRAGSLAGAGQGAEPLASSASYPARSGGLGSGAALISGFTEHARRGPRSRRPSRRGWRSRLLWPAPAALGPRADPGLARAEAVGAFRTGTEGCTSPPTVPTTSCTPRREEPAEHGPALAPTRPCSAGPESAEPPKGLARQAVCPHARSRSPRASGGL